MNNPRRTRRRRRTEDGGRRMMRRRRREEEDGGGRREERGGRREEREMKVATPADVCVNDGRLSKGGLRSHPAHQAFQGASHSNTLLPGSHSRIRIRFLQHLPTRRCRGLPVHDPRRCGPPGQARLARQHEAANVQFCRYRRQMAAPDSSKPRTSENTGRELSATPGRDRRW